jgi:hypothetical protein
METSLSLSAVGCLLAHDELASTGRAVVIDERGFGLQHGSPRGLDAVRGSWLGLSERHLLAFAD